MNIQIPVQFKDIKLNDREKIFAWMIYELSKKMDSIRWEQHALFLCKQDVTHILGRTDGNRLENLREVFDIAILNGYTVSVQWKSSFSLHKWGSGRKTPLTYTDTLDSDEHLVMYVYLLGRLTGSDVFSEDNKQVLKTRETTHPINRQVHMLYKSYYADELHGDD